MNDITKLVELETLINQARADGIPEHEIAIALSGSDDIQDQPEKKVTSVDDVFNSINGDN